MFVFATRCESPKLIKHLFVHSDPDVNVFCKKQKRTNYTFIIPVRAPPHHFDESSLSNTVSFGFFIFRVEGVEWVGVVCMERRLDLFSIFGMSQGDSCEMNKFHSMMRPFRALNGPIRHYRARQGPLGPSGAL